MAITIKEGKFNLILYVMFVPHITLFLASSAVGLVGLVDASAVLMRLAEPK